MRKPEIDYRTFRLSKLNDPQFAHLKLLGGWIGYFIMYFLTENLIPEESCHVVHCWIDDLIPFCEWFLIPYVFWYFLIVFTLLYLMLYHVEGFKRFQIFIIVTQVVAMAIYIIYPNRQDMRPEVFPRENFLTACIGLLYRQDTPTGVCPSLHVAYSMGIASAWLKERTCPSGSRRLSSWRWCLSALPPCLSSSIPPWTSSWRCPSVCWRRESPTARATGLSAGKNGVQ